MVKSKAHLKKQRKQSFDFKRMIIPIMCIILALIVGILTKDILISSITIGSGLLGGYFAGEGKRISYICGTISYSLTSYIAFSNGLFGTFFFCLAVFIPLQIYGFISWTANSDSKNIVKAKSFNLLKSIFVVSLCLLGSASIGYILTLIPEQNLAFLDATGNAISLCACILMTLRYKEAWYLWISSSIVYIIIWSIAILQNGKNSIAMLILQIGYLMINISGLIKWGIRINKIKSRKRA